MSKPDGTYADELKPCPFCGGKNLVFTASKIKGHSYIECWTCLMHGPISKGWAWVKRKWNAPRRGGEHG